MAILVTGCGRSGTLYIATVLRALGISTSHEQVFTPDRREPPTSFPYEASSSWLAAPFVGMLPEDRVVFHQVRDPMAVIASLLGIHFFRPLRPLPVGAAAGDAVELARRFLLRRAGRPIRVDYVRFVRWADPAITAARDEVGRSIAYWVRWNAMIQARAPSDRTVRYRLEDVDADLLSGVLERGGIDRSREQIQRALTSVSSRTNARHRDARAADRIRAHPRYDELIRAASPYGYPLDG